MNSKKLLKWLIIIVLLTVFAVVLFVFYVKIPIPMVRNSNSISQKNKLNDSTFRVSNSFLQLNKYGHWIVHIEKTNSYNRGLIYGELCSDLIKNQEDIFVNQIKEIIPNEYYLNFLKYFIAFFNRNIYKHIPNEYKNEMYGISQYFSDDYDFIAPKYYRILNYHAAHDIGHALNDFQLVGCTSFAIKDSKSIDNKLLIARNFDFYMGEEFSKDKLISFVVPDSGFAYTSIAWAGLIGVVSGMNEKGLTVTINASKSEIPTKSKMPISILCREILQYASNLEEAKAIAQKRQIFVSESIMIGSASDNKAIIVEKNPENTDVFESNSPTLICSNHYQSNLFKNTDINIQNIQQSDSKYRFNRTKELLDKQTQFNVSECIKILRNKEGKNNQKIGLGNQKSINQLIAHHGVVFSPSELKMWVSSNPNVLGTFVCYDLSKIRTESNFIIDSLSIKADTFLYSKKYKNYELFRELKNDLVKNILFDKPLPNQINLKDFIELNPNYYNSYVIAAEYEMKQNKWNDALNYLYQSKKHEVASKNEIEKIEELINICKEHIK